MNRLCACLAVTAALVLSAGPAGAQKIDVQALTCGELVKMNADGISTVFLWLDGYYSGLEKDTTLDFDSLGEALKKITEYCGKNTKLTVMKAIDKLSK